MKFRQNNDLFYLSGVDQEETVLVVFPDCPIRITEVLFVRETNDHDCGLGRGKLSKAKATSFRKEKCIDASVQQVFFGLTLKRKMRGTR